MGPKEAGSPTGKRAGDFLHQYLIKQFPGSRVWREPFQVVRQKPLKGSIRFGGTLISAHLYENTGVTGSLVSGSFKMAGWWSLLTGSKRLSGKIIIVKQSVLLHRLWVAIKALSSGAVGVIYISRVRRYIPGGLGYPYTLGSCSIPVLGITPTDLKRLKKSRVDSVELHYSSAMEVKVECQNIIVRSESESNKHKPALVLGAHYDSWFGGAHDNCIAVQLMTDVYEKLSRMKLRHPIMAIYWDAEEIGLNGSRYHLDHVVDDPYAFYFNFEMPIPTRTGLLNTLFYSDHSVCKRALCNTAYFKSSLIPLPLKTFYKAFPGFPADIDDFYKQDIPSMTTFCSNPLIHTPLDNGENLRWKSYPLLRQMIFKTLCEVDGIL